MQADLNPHCTHMPTCTLCWIPAHLIRICYLDDFESEALLVPQRCVFDHVHDNNQCERPTKWSETASTLCQGENRVLESWGMLVVCGTDRFRGVEFVCCPKGKGIQASRLGQNKNTCV